MGNSGGTIKPEAAAQGQWNYNLAAAKTQQKLNQTNQQNQYGALTYTKGPDGRYVATTTLNPEQQKIFDQQQSNQQQSGQIAGDVLGAWGQQYGGTTGFDTTDTANYLFDLGNQRLAPNLERQRAATETALLNKGIVPGTEAYARAMEAVGQQENDAWNQLYLTGQQQAYNQLQQNYQTPLQAYSALYGLSQGTPPQSAFVNTPQVQVQAPDYIGAVNSYNKAQTDSQNGMLGGIGGLAGDVLGLGIGGGNTIGGAMFTSMFSDARLKKNAERVGTLDNGLPVYAYEYKAGGPRHIGVMAQDVAHVHPEALTNVGGFWAVDYEKAVT